VTGGRFTAPVPRNSRRAWAALIPERRPQPLPDLLRGEALPVEVIDYERQLQQGFLPFQYTAYRLEITIAADILAKYPDLEIEFPHYRWTPRGYHQEPARESIAASPFVLNLLTFNRFNLRISGRGGFRHFQEVLLDRDTGIAIGR
jgi:hypothetical protein